MEISEIRSTRIVQADENGAHMPEPAETGYRADLRGDLETAISEFNWRIGIFGEARAFKGGVNHGKVYDGLYMIGQDWAKLHDQLLEYLTRPQD